MGPADARPLAHRPGPFFCQAMSQRHLAQIEHALGNVGFLIYIADSFGYLGSVGILFYKNFAQPDMTWISFFVNGSLIVSVFGISLMILSMLFFSKKHKKKSTDENILIAGYALPKGVTDRH